MAQTLPSCSAVTGEKMASPSINLHPDKRSPTNGHSSPARNGKTTPSNTERKPHINGHASPLHLAPNTSNNHTVAEAYMKTDDRMRLAKERREERERSLAAREQLIREKERRARLQYERTMEERWRRLEEQRQKEELRRAAVEEKRRQQLEEERERLEALMKRSLERSLQLEQRNKRWSRGYTSGVGDSENTPLPFSAASVFSHGIASPFPAASESAPCSPHRSPFCSSLNPADHNRAGLQGGSQSTPNTPKKERLRRERRTASPGYGSPVRRSESPASVTKHLASPTTSKLAKMRAQSPSNTHQYHYSPTRHRTNPSSDDRKAAEKNVEQSKPETTMRKNTNYNGTNPTPQAEKILAKAEIHITRSQETFDKRLKGDTSEKNQSPDRKVEMISKVDPSEKKMQTTVQDGDKKKESAPNTSTGKLAAGTTNAEEATRMLAERRRQARAQKELEEKKRELEEEKRPKEELLKKQQEQQHHKLEVQQVKDKGKNEEGPNRTKQEEDKQKEEQQELQTQTDKEKVKVKVQAQEDAERQRQDRELQTQQEEEERQLRKKRIEEIMKRTRKGEADLKKEEVETNSVSPPEEVKTLQSNAQVNEQASKMGEFPGKDLVTDNSTKECALVEKKLAAAAAGAARVDNQKSMQVKTSTHQVAVAHSAPVKRSGTNQTSDESGGQIKKEAKVCTLKQQEREVEINVGKQHIANVKSTDQIEKEPAKLAEGKAAAKTSQREGGMINGAVKGEESPLMRNRSTAEVSKQQSLHVSAAAGNAKGGSQMEGIRPSVTPLPVGHMSPPVIKLEPLDVKGTESCDGVQSMEVSPASKEELISIPEFSPINEIQLSSMSNARALEDLMDLTGGVTYPKLSSEGTVGDCNKNLIEGVVSPMSDSKLIGMTPPSSNKLSIQ
ncbi:hypothetical protein Q5P01_019620 [Channa striata]|uniref:MAP7 domain-containing protein 2-like n=1 Tax=Channa striata TaxID=64152 RepID=A0AA88M1X1_CHASR|nr:hypothetical protein Q5P01_019620 [Channa striata]